MDTQPRRLVDVFGASVRADGYRLRLPRRSRSTASPAGVIAIIIELTRVSQFLSQLTVGKSAGAFILERDGNVVAAPDPDANELNELKTDHPLFSGRG